MQRGSSRCATDAYLRRHLPLALASHRRIQPIILGGAKHPTLGRGRIHRLRGPTAEVEFWGGEARSVSAPIGLLLLLLRAFI